MKYESNNGEVKLDGFPAIGVRDVSVTISPVTMDLGRSIVPTNEQVVMLVGLWDPNSHRQYKEAKIARAEEEFVDADDAFADKFMAAIETGKRLERETVIEELREYFDECHQYQHPNSSSILKFLMEDSDDG